jgi:hypothetical protein
LYHTLPAVFWLLAGACCVLAWFLSPSPSGKVWDLYLPAALVLVVLLVVTRIQRHASSVEQCLWVGLLLGLAALWLPTVLFLVLPVWGYLIYRNIFSFRSFLSTLVGFAFVAIWTAVFLFCVSGSAVSGSFTSTGISFFSNLLSWLPVAAVSSAFIASSATRHALRLR